MASRSIDIIVAAIGLVLLSPLYLLISSIVRLTSPGPVHFHQDRIGQQGKVFRIHKFRTMHADTLNSGVAITIGGDPRITSAGHVLRRLKLDELPQLFNVLTGDMCLVGPRPEVAHYVALYPEPLRTEVLAVRPGITDLASLCFIDESR
ncbi:MAG: sugar transferase, partial [Steroidobacteraceae bacterium]